MFLKAISPLWLLLGSALAAPTRQNPLALEKSPYNRKYHDRYDRKFDSYGEDVQPLPLVSLYVQMLSGARTPHLPATFGVGFKG